MAAFRPTFRYLVKIVLQKMKGSTNNSLPLGWLASGK